MIFRDVTATRATALKMAYMAQHDGLTDLPNRILMNDRLSEAITLSTRHHRKLAVLFLDIDRFKLINDSLGHAVGDRLLQSVALRLFACVRSSDTVSRQGGDEFVVLLWELRNPEDAAVTADKMLHALREPHRIEQHELHITASIGIATYPDDGTDADSLIEKADTAMYHAKEKGRDNYQFFKSEMNARAVERQSFEGRLYNALERDELILHFQPMIDLANGNFVGVEALIRWNHPVRAWFSPRSSSRLRRIAASSYRSAGGWCARLAARPAPGRLRAGLRWSWRSTSPRRSSEPQASCKVCAMF